MRIPLLVAALAGVAACSPQIPDSAAGVGFGDYDQYEATQSTRAAAAAIPPAGAISDETAPPPAASELAAASPTPTPRGATTVQPIASARTTATATTATDSAELAAETEALLAAMRANSGQVPLEASPDNPPPQTVTTGAGISAENDFEAVGAVRSIEADAEFLARTRQQYKVIKPTALPSRDAAKIPNIVEYALRTHHPVGTKVYSRIGLNKQARYERNCAAYPSPDQAQIDFLARGGPKRDRKGLDPDGDGYACDWDPAPFRKAVSG